MMVTLIKSFILPSQWRQPLIMLAVVLSVMLLLYLDTVASITTIWWHSETFAHGMLIIPLSLYMIWTQRHHLAPLQPVTSWWGMILLLPVIIVWLLGAMVDVMVIQQLALLFMIWAVILTVLGWSVVKHILFPLIFLFFLVPLGEGLIPILMDITAAFTVKALTLTGFPVYWEGMHFTIPSGNFEVAKACSGVRYLFASVVLGCLFAYINYNSIKKRALFILFSILLPIVANSLRAYGIVLIAHYSDLKYAVGFDHLIYGWLFFGFIMFLLFYIGSKWREELPAAPDYKQPVLAKVGVSVLMPQIVVLLLLTSGPMAIALTPTNHIGSEKIVLIAPQDNGQWRQTERHTQRAWKIGFKGASHEIKTAYVNSPYLVRLYIAYYARESQGAELINQTNSLYDTRQWTEVQRNEKKINIAGKSVRVHEKILHSGDHERILWYNYDLNGVVIPNIYMSKLIQAWQRLTGSDLGGAVVVLMADVITDRQTAIEQLQNFNNAMYQEIQASLAAVRKSRI